MKQIKWKRSAAVVLRLVLAAALMASMALCCRADVEQGPFGEGFEIADAKKGTVRILQIDSLTDPSYASLGSGFGVGIAGEETEYFITNRHVVFNEDTNRVVSTVYILTDDNAVRETSIGVEFNNSYMIPCEVIYPSNDDPEFPDFAILKAQQKVEGRMALPLRRTETVSDGTNVWAIGYPGSGDNVFNYDPDQGEQKLEADVEGSKLTSGIITGRGRAAWAGKTYMLSTSAHINSGSSGGPLLTNDGEVIGINTYAINATQTGGEYNGAIYIDYVINKLDELEIAYNDFPGRENEEGDESEQNEEDELKKREEEEKRMRLLAAAAAAALLAVGAALLLWSKVFSRRKKRYWLQGLSGQYAAERYPIDQSICFGREPGQNNLVFTNRRGGISRFHCRILKENGVLFLEDLNSTNGTYLNGIKLVPNQPVRLEAGDEFWLATRSERFRIDLKHIH